MPPPNAHELAILASLDFEVLRPHFYKPLSKVAVDFGVCATVFKKRCRDLGVKRWPFRKIRSLRRSMTRTRRPRACGSRSPSQVSGGSGS